MKRALAVVAATAVLLLPFTPATARLHHHHRHHHPAMVLCWNTTWTTKAWCDAWWAQWNAANG